MIKGPHGASSVMVSSAARAAARSNRPPPLPLHSTPLHSPFPGLFSLLPLTSSPSPPSLTPPSSSSPSPLPKPGGTWRPTTPQEAQPRGAAKRSSQDRS
ncbi:hypothetical protein QJQ45_025920 [Haematococcus lacustris]|nr:hypothetical protein QJQ45_025920 [Haematococcus lacustris]